MTDDRIDRLERLTRLRDQGVLSSDEFEAEKARVLGSASENKVSENFQPAQRTSAVEPKRDQNIWLYLSLGLLALIAVLAFVILMPLNAAPPPQEAFIPAVVAPQLADPGSLDPLPEIAPFDTPVAAVSGPVPPEITSEWRNMRTRIREDWGTEPTFAERYVIIRWGCGTACTFGIVGDQRTGRIHELGLGGEEQSSLTMRYGRTSNRLTARWDDWGQCIEQDFEWDGSKLVPVGQRQTRPRPESCSLAYSDWFFEED